MLMMSRLLLLFLITPVIELALLLEVGDRIGFWPTIALIVATGVAGSLLMRYQGMAVWGRFNRRLAQGGLPGKELADGVIILVAGAFLLTPGVLTDVVGLVGLIPLTRAPLRNYLMKRVRRKMDDGTVRMQFGGFGVGGPHPPGASDPEEPDAAWGGRGRDVPNHAEEDAEPSRTDSPS
jgi:UPF0716 protein FxsA